MPTWLQPWDNVPYWYNLAENTLYVETGARMQKLSKSFETYLIKTKGIPTWPNYYRMVTHIFV